MPMLTSFHEQEPYTAPWLSLMLKVRTLHNSSQVVAIEGPMGKYTNHYLGVT
jgi:hypothetical protein